MSSFNDNFRQMALLESALSGVFACDLLTTVDRDQVLEAFSALATCDYISMYILTSTLDGT